MTSSEVFVGIDVHKSQLEMRVHERAEHWEFDNDAEGIAALVATLRIFTPTLVAVEASGGYERAVVVKGCAAGLPVAVANPTRVRRSEERSDEESLAARPQTVSERDSSLPSGRSPVPAPALSLGRGRGSAGRNSVDLIQQLLRALFLHELPHRFDNNGFWFHNVSVTGRTSIRFDHLVLQCG